VKAEAEATDIEPAKGAQGLRGLAALSLCTAVLVACGGGQSAPGESADSTRAGLEHYLVQIEPIRLGVNRLLEGADPILAGFREHRIPAREAAASMAALERRFAAFTVAVAAVRPKLQALRSLHAEYAQTYVLEDAYLSALAADLARQELSDLPDSQSAQRVAIIRWRTGLTVLAEEAHVALPADLQQAGRGEIAPSPEGS
jgi:hypothetical protein